MSTLTEFSQGWIIVVAVIGGVAGDALLKLWAVTPERTFATRAFAASTSAVLWVANFLVVRVAYDIHWPFDDLLGARVHPRVAFDPCTGLLGSDAGFGDHTEVAVATFKPGGDDPHGGDRRGPNSADAGLRTSGDLRSFSVPRHTRW